MLALEIIMLIMGIGAVILSFRITDNVDKKTDVISDDMLPSDESSDKEMPTGKIQNGLTAEEKERLLNEQREKLQEIAAEVSYETEDKLSSMSNEKIMGFSEYSEQILDKMEKNHAETVFLYDMLNEKEKEIKKLVHEADVAKTSLHDELLKEYQERKGYGKRETELTGDNIYSDEFFADNLKRADIVSGVDADGTAKDEDGDVVYDISPMEKGLVSDNSVFMDGDEELGNKEEAADDALTLDRTSLYDAEIARIEQEEKKSRMLSDSNTDVEHVGEPELNPPIDMKKNKSEIISMFKEGKTVLEISKILSIGQGEVKLVIDMYKARKG